MRKHIIRSFLLTVVLLLVMSFVVLRMTAFTVDLDARVESLYEIAAMDSVESTDQLTIKYYSPRSSLEEVQSAVEHGRTFLVHYSEGSGQVLTVYVYQPVQRRVISISQPYVTSAMVRTVIVPYSLGSAILLALAGYALVNYQSRRIMRPIYKLDKALSQEPFDLKTTAPELEPIVNKIKQMEEKIQEDVKLRAADSRMQQEFFSNASHELKTPLTSIQGYTELMSTGLMTEEQQKICLESITRESQRMRNLIQDILTVSQLESGQQKNFCTVFNLKDMAEEIELNLQPQARKKNINFSMSCQDMEIFAFEKHIHSILENLMENAIKYNKENGSVTVKITQQHGSCRIFVSDTGIGMSEESVAKMFDRFYRADKQRGPEIPGTGLGMSIVKTAVDHYEGTINVQSELGEGTIIEVLLPIVVEKPEDAEGK